MLLWHCVFRTRGLTALTTIISGVTTLTLVAIIVIIWLVLPNDYDWSQQLQNSLTFFDIQKSGNLPASNPIPWRGNSALSDAAPNGASLVGGYYIDGGKSAAAMSLFPPFAPEFFLRPDPLSTSDLSLIQKEAGIYQMLTGTTCPQC